MTKNLIDFFKDKKILILGFGKEGKSTYNFIRSNFPNKKIFVADKNENIKEDEILKSDKNVQLNCGKQYLDELECYDVIMKAPGISLKNIDTSKIREKIKSQLELLLEFIDVKTIGITGTKGKSTTSSLIYQVLKDQNKEVMLMGNIGVPVFNCLEEMKEKMYIVLEISSHQLEFMNTSPNISILLNVYEEHLDHYNSLDSYVEAKCNIYSHQKKDDYYIYNLDIDKILEKNEKFKTEATKFAVTLENKKLDGNRTYIKDEKIYINDKSVYSINSSRKLLGTHNLNNIMFVLTVSEILKLDIKKTINTINKFETLPHRIEYVGKYEGITFYNDSIATIPEATINSVEALKNVNTLIIGGIDRGISYNKLIDYLNSSNNIENIICLPTTGHKIGEQITNGNTKVFNVETMEDAVSKAKQYTRKDTICLLSPAAASYGFFKNFEDRGNKFKELVKESKE